VARRVLRLALPFGYCYRYGPEGGVMSDYRRWYEPGGTYFFAAVTHRRRPILCGDPARACLREALEIVRARYPLQIVAVVLQPEHLHTVWTLPRGDADYSIRSKRIKEEFTRLYLSRGGSEAEQSNSRRKQGERGVWQRRFWEHLVRDEADLKRCVDYVH
jgi:putative transposase